MIRPRSFLVLIPGAFLGAAVAVGYGCTTTTTAVTEDTLTAVIIKTNALIAAYGCGTGPGQVYKYTATVTPSPADGQTTYTGTFDCFADGWFVNLPTPDAGFQDFTVDISAFNADTFNAGGTAATPNWQAACCAAGELNIQVLAVCNPLTPTGVDAGLPPPVCVNALGDH